MLIAWINDDGQLNYTDNMNVVPELYRDRVVVFENLTLDDGEWLVIDGSQIRYIADEAERVKLKKQDLLLRIELALRHFLSQTDHFVIECVERGLNLSEVYPEVFAQRNMFRQRANDLKQLLNQLTNLEQIEEAEKQVQAFVADCYREGVPKRV